MGELSYTVGGDSNLVSFKSAARVPITSLKAHFKPKQDLHGYSKAWPAGGGKNLFNKENSIIDGFIHSTTGAFYPESIGEQCIVSDYLEAGTYTISKISSTRFRVGVYATPNPSAYEECYEYYTANPMTSTSFTITTTHDGYFVIFCFNGENNETHTTQEIADTVQIEKGSTATSYEPYENICPIEGWNEIKEYTAGKNIGHIVGYSAVTLNSPMNKGALSNPYGTTIDTTDYFESDTPLIITQENWPETDSISSYKNGYIVIELDNLKYSEYYDISFKVSNITSNPLNATLQNLQLGNPAGTRRGPTEVHDNILIYRNFPFTQLNTKPNRMDFDVRICGMSFTLSEFMVTKANTNDGVFEPYCGEIIPVTFPVIGKNKLPLNSTTFTRYKKISLNTLLPPGIYTVSALVTSTDTDTTISSIMFEKGSLNGSNLYIYIERDNRDTKTFTLYQAVSTVYLYAAREYVTSAGDEATWTDIQVELGDTATEYEPYSSNNTVYGGYVDIAKGELVQTYYKMILDENCNFNLRNVENHVQEFRLANSRFPLPSNNDNIFCKISYLTKILDPSEYIPWTFYKNASTKALFIRVPDIYNTVESIQNYFKNNPAEFVYGLATPIIYQLSPIQLKTFLNQNYIWSNTNDITEVSYAIHDTAPIHTAKKRMAAENDKHYRKVLWNQMAGPMTSSYWELYNTKVSSVDYIDDYAEVTINKTATYGYEASIRTSNDIVVTTDHYYYASYLVCPNYSGAAFGMEFAGGTTIGRYDAPINEWTMIPTGKIKGFRNGGGKLYIPYFVNGTYQAGDKAKVKNIIYVDLTKMFGHGNEPTGPEFRRMCAMNNIDFMSYHPIDSGTEQIWCIPGHDTNEYITVNWNQLCKELTTSNYKPQNSNYASISAENGVMTTTILQDISEVYQSSFISNYNIAWDVSHRYYYKQEINSSTNSTYYLIYKSRCGAYQALPSNTWITLEAIASPEATDSNTIFLAYNVDKTVGGVAGASCQVRNPILIDLTKMFGAGNEPTTVAELRETCLKNNINLDTAQPYTTGSTIIWKK